MPTRNKLCRALACSRKIAHDALFCSVHFPQLTGRLVAPIADNREAPAGADPAVKQRIKSHTAQAVYHLAKSEGRGAAAARALLNHRVVPGQGGEGNTAYNPTTGHTTTDDGTPLYSDRPAFPT